jgi:biopolymer transport protein ExbD
MAEIIESGGGGHKKGGKKRPKKGSTRVDMTPMVDLAFLLLTFFVMTSTFSKPKVMSLVYPAKPEVDKPAPPQEINNAITFLLTEDKIFYYEGQFRATPGDGKPATKLSETTFGAQGVRKLLADKNSFVLKEKAKLEAKLLNKEIADSTYTRLLIEAKKNNASLKVLVKTDVKASCKNFIDLIDELKINDIGVIAPVDMMASEEKLLNAEIEK